MFEGLSFIVGKGMVFEALEDFALGKESSEHIKSKKDKFKIYKNLSLFNIEILKAFCGLTSD